MPSATTKTTKARSGTILVEACVSLGVTLITLLTLSSLSLVWIAKLWMSAEAYTLARAHLYHNDLNRCDLSLTWPKNRYIESEFQCNRRGEVFVETHIKPLLFFLDAPLSFQTHFRLDPGE